MGLVRPRYAPPDCTPPSRRDIGTLGLGGARPAPPDSVGWVVVDDPGGWRGNGWRAQGADRHGFYLGDVEGGMDLHGFG